MTDTLPKETVANASEASAPARAPKSRRGTSGSTPARNLEVLEKLAALYPHLFGATFLPLKRGIFQDLLATHPDTFAREELKAALAMHTRSTRYLTAVASGTQRHDLQGQAVEPMAPEHVYHAILEVSRRRMARTGQNLRGKLVERIVQAFDASGLSQFDYAELVRTRDEAANAVLDEAMAVAQARAAKDEALLRAFESSASSPEAFAEMYGLDVRAVRTMLQRTQTNNQVLAEA
jgi:ProP effector